MPINIHILSTSKNIKPYVENLKSITGSTINLVEKLLPIKDVDIVLYENPIATIKEIGGIGGFSPNSHTVFIALDTRNVYFEQAIKDELPFTLAHELHHTVRWQKIVEEDTLLEALIFEGLADHFAMQVTGKKNVPVYSRALTDEQKKILLDKAKKEWKKPTYDNSLWFFGSNPDQVPRWTGYTLGFDLVQKYLNKHPGSFASKLVNEDAESFEI